MIDPSALQSTLTVPAELQNVLQDDMETVNTFIREKIQSPVALIPQVAHHIIRGGGKRLRPLLTLAAGKMFTQEPSAKLCKLAAAIECLHTASLLHDDVVDESDMRRNQPTANTIWGNAASILVGDYVLARGFDFISELENVGITHIISRAASRIAEGEVLELSEAHNLTMPLDTYLRIIESKTAELFASAMKAGALLSGATDRQAHAFYDYGINLGIIFQLTDDNLDYLRESQELGKPKGTDFRDGQVTLPVLLAYEKGTPEEQVFWRRTIQERKQTNDDLNTAIRYISKHNVFDNIYTLCYRYVERAQGALHLLPTHPLRDYLFRIIEYCIHRRF